MLGLGSRGVLFTLYLDAPVFEVYSGYILRRSPPQDLVRCIVTLEFFVCSFILSLLLALAGTIASISSDVYRLSAMKGILVSISSHLIDKCYVLEILHEFSFEVSIDFSV